MALDEIYNYLPWPMKYKRIFRHASYHIYYLNSIKPYLYPFFINTIRDRLLKKFRMCKIFHIILDVILKSILPTYCPLLLYYYLLLKYSSDTTGKFAEYIIEIRVLVQC